MPKSLQSCYLDYALANIDLKKFLASMALTIFDTYCINFYTTWYCHHLDTRLMTGTPKAKFNESKFIISPNNFFCSSLFNLISLDHMSSNIRSFFRNYLPFNIRSSQYFFFSLVFVLFYFSACVFSVFPVDSF